jgi:hypothetical protein
MDEMKKSEEESKYDAAIWKWTGVDGGGRDNEGSEIG